MNWVTSFQQRFDLLQRDLDPFISTYIRTYKHDYRQFQRVDIDIIIDNLTTLSQWVHALPTDEEVWTYVTLKHVLEPGMRQLTSLHGAFAIALNPRRVTPGSALWLDLSRLQGQVARVRTLLQNCPLQGLSPSAAETLLTVPPLVLTNTLWLELFFRWTTQPLKAPQMRDWPAVVYRPSSTNRLVRRLVESVFALERAESVNIVPQRTPHFFEMALTRPNLPLRPDFWATMLPRLPQDELGHLREMGGEIAPLLKSEDQGEGVVVRLPWAKREGEQ